MWVWEASFGLGVSVVKEGGIGDGWAVEICVRDALLEGMWYEAASEGTVLGESHLD